MNDQLWIARPTRQPPAAEHLKRETTGGSLRFPTRKPHDGSFWTSTLDAQGSDWLRWCLSESYADPREEPGARWWRLRPRADAKIYEIATVFDLIRLIDAFPEVAEHGYAIGGQERGVCWEDALAEYDGIHLTAAGQAATRYDVGFGYTDLYGWDCESTCWGRWVFDEVEEIDGTPLIAAAVAREEAEDLV